MYKLKNRELAKHLSNSSPNSVSVAQLSANTALIVTVAMVLLVTDTTSLFAQTKAECQVSAQANNALLDTSDIQSCNDSSGVGIAAAIQNIFAPAQPSPAPSPAVPVDTSTTPTPGSHVAISGAVALDATISVPGGGSLNTTAGLSVNDSVNSPISGSPLSVSGIGGGGGVAGAGSVGNGSGQGSGSGSGNSFVESALSNAGASSSASGLGAGLGLGGGVGLSGSLD